MEATDRASILAWLGEGVRGLVRAAPARRTVLSLSHDVSGDCISIPSVHDEQLRSLRRRGTMRFGVIGNLIAVAGRERKFPAVL